MTTSTQPRFNLFDQLDRSLNSLVRSFEGDAVPKSFPRLSIYEVDGSLFVECDVPGFALSELGVRFDNGTLLLSGTTAVEDPDCCGRNFERSLQLGQEWSGDSIDASLLNGVLTIQLRKAPEYEARQIQIRDGQSAD